MKIKKVIALVIAIGLLSYSVLYAEEKLPKDKPGTAVFVMTAEKKGMITVTTNVIKEAEKHLKIDMKIPIMDNFNNKFFQKRLNNKIKKDQLSLKSEIEKDTIRNYQYATKKGLPVIPYELMTNYHVKSNNDIFSLEITVYDYRGGAHGMTTNIYYNIDTKRSKLLSLKDYFKPGSDYEEILNKEISQQIDQRRLQGEIFFEDGLGFKGIKENQSFYINQEGQLVIVFGLYEIAPYVAGIIEFPIPQEIIESITS